MDHEDFVDTEAGASDECTFNIAHQDASGLIYFDVVRTTLSPEKLARNKEVFRRASADYYQAIGHKLVHIQISEETSRPVKGKPRLKMIKGGLLGTVLAMSSVMSSGMADVDGWLSEAEMAAEVASLERRHGMARHTALKHDVFGQLFIYGCGA